MGYFFYKYYCVARRKKYKIKMKKMQMIIARLFIFRLPKNQNCHIHWINNPLKSLPISQGSSFNPSLRRGINGKVCSTPNDVQFVSASRMSSLSMCTVHQGAPYREKSIGSLDRSLCSIEERFEWKFAIAWADYLAATASVFPAAVTSRLLRPKE